MRPLVVVSNRVPAPTDLPVEERARSGPVGGLVSAVRPAIEEHGGVWFGWSGHTSHRRMDSQPTVIQHGKVRLATLHLTEDEVSLYYTGFANRTLWPLLHSLPERVNIRQNTYKAYRRVNRRFAEALLPLLPPEALVWVHDYHLFHMGRELRKLGWRGKMGFFLHVPFPSDDIFSILPWARDILEALTCYDLVGVHTKRYLSNLVDTLECELKGAFEGGVFSYSGGRVRLGSYPVGIDPEPFKEAVSAPEPGPEGEFLKAITGGSQVVLGVDRLDYTKGIPERLMAFERLLESYPSMRGSVSFVQVSVPSRTRVPEYVREKERVDRLVGRINGRFTEAGWVPIRYLYRSFPPGELARLYHDADVCMVTPLRDGMNLVAKEFVASQDGADPGVLVLSRFSGAAASMKEALIVNPYDVEATAKTLYRALRMPRPERQRRWRALMATVEGWTAQQWRDAFLRDLLHAP